MRIVLFTLSLFILAGCGKKGDFIQAKGVSPAARAAEFNKGQGLLLTPEAITFIGLCHSEVQLKSDKVILPTSALLRTSDGAFVFIQNGQRWLRASVKVDAESVDTIQITDGLFEGDVVAVAGVWDLWLAELQAIKGGVGCADGH